MSKRENLFMEMRFFEALKLYTMGFILKLKFSLRLFGIILIALVLIFGVAGLNISLNYVKNNFSEQANNITKNTASNLQMITDEMEKTLKNASIATQKIFEQNPKLTRIELIKLANALGVTAISLFNTDGHFFLTTSMALEPSYDKYWYYKELSVTSLEYCDEKLPLDGNTECKIVHSTFKKSLDRPYQSFSIPMFGSKPRKTPSMWAISYNPIVGKIFDISYSGIDINKIINETLETHKGYLTYIAITDNENNIIAEVGAKNKNTMEVAIPYGKKWHFEVEGKPIYYSYNLKIEFDTTELNKQLFVLKVLFTVIMMLVIFLIIVIRLRFYDKDLTVQRKVREMLDKFFPSNGTRH